MNTEIINGDILTKSKKEANWFHHKHKQKPGEHLFEWKWISYIKPKIFYSVKPEKELIIELESDIIGTLPPPLKDIYNTIQRSKYILDFDINWDDEGSPSYKKSTWKIAVEFLINLSVYTFNKMRFIIPTPHIYHGPEGSIDILWEKEDYRLLINIPENISSPASFYGDDYNLDKIEGTFDPRKINLGILLSLMEF